MFRFFLLSPATSYAGEYIWQGDAKSGCERILKDTGIAREEWQMGVTKAFIKNPETVCLSIILRINGLIYLLVICVRNYAGPILAQYGYSYPARLAELHEIQT